MSLHAEPKTPAEKFAQHLELDYGVQLDPARHQALVRELEAFAVPVAQPEAPPTKPVRKPRAKAQEKADAER